MPTHSSEVDTTTLRGLGPTAFKAAMARFASGVTIVTTHDADGTPRGFTASSFCSVSLDPPLVLVCLAKSASSYPAFRDCDRFAVSVLRAEQTGLARRFAEKGADKFTHGRFVAGTSGVAVVDDALALVECTAEHRYEAGDHVILVGRVEHADAGSGSPAVYFDRGFSTLSERR